jgi:hypothetical protein
MAIIRLRRSSGGLPWCYKGARRTDWEHGSIFLHSLHSSPLQVSRGGFLHAFHRDHGTDPMLVGYLVSLSYMGKHR